MKTSQDTANRRQKALDIISAIWNGSGLERSRSEMIVLFMIVTVVGIGPVCHISTVSYQNAVTAACESCSYGILEGHRRYILTVIQEVDSIRNSPDYPSPRIPKIIHQIWNDDVIPTEFVENVKSFIKYNPYPEWDYYFWTLDLGREFVKQKFPKLLKIYDSLGVNVRPNILRILVIYYYGGAYFDLDIESVRPLDRFVDNHECVLSGPVWEHTVAYDYATDHRRVNNAVLLCRPNHPFFRHLIARTEDRSEMCLPNGSCPRPEFPFPLLVHLTDARDNESLPEIVEHHFFEPIYDLTVTGKLRQKCSGKSYRKLVPKKQRICDDWRRLGEHKRTVGENAYTSHTWYHTSIRNVKRDRKNKISKLVPHVKIYNPSLEELYGVV